MENAIQGPGIFLAQFVRENPPFNTIDGLADWASAMGYRGLQIPAWDSLQPEEKKLYDM